MAYFISNECHGCGDCIGKCPAGAIYESDHVKFIIDPQKCVSCGMCKKTCWYDIPEKE